MTTKKNLTKRTIEAMKDPASGRDTYQDEADKYLHLVVTPSARVWRYIRKVNGQVVFITLGRYPDMTPDQARQASRKTSADYTNGKDPREEKRKGRNVATWKDLFDWYMETHARPKKRTWKGDEDQERLYCSEWRNRAWNTITPELVTRWHKNIGHTRGKITADRALSLVKTVFNRAIDADLIDGRNPTRGVSMNFKTAKKYSRSRFLRGDEIKRLFAALDGYHDQDMADFFRLAVLTGARRGNVQAMRWQDFDGAAGLWTIPAAQSKSGVEMEVSILPPAAEILNHRWDNHRSDTWVFPAKRSNAKTPHLSEPKKAWAAICKKADLQDVRIHDLRRTLGSWMANSGASLLVIGKALGHQDSKTTQIYARLGADPVRAGVGAAVEQMMLAAHGTSDKTEAVK